MIWDYTEVNPFSESTGNWDDSILYLCRVIDHLSQMGSSLATVTQSSAMALQYPDNFFDAVFTDPPYYDNVPYSYLSDFYYVWLKRTIGDLYPELFSTPLSPKKNEIVAYSNGPGGSEEGAALFETMLKRSFQEIYRVLKPDGIAIIVYAHKSTQAWETLINSLLDSKLVVTASWPLNTERSTRLRSQESAALASSTYLVVRKFARLQTAFYNDVKSELQAHLKTKLQRLWADQHEPLDPSVKRLIERDLSEKNLFSGADFFISAIGSAIEIFGKYEKIIDYEGEVIRADRLLDDVRTIVTDFAVTQILHNGFGGKISNLTRFYVLWRWNYGETRVQFDDARKLAQSCAIDLAQEWDKRGFIQKEGEFIRVLGPQMRRIESLEGSRELIDVLHYSCLLWGSSKRDEMLTVLNESGFGKSEAFYRVAQAISETLLNDSKEKQLLDGFLAGKERIKRDIKNGVGPTTLSDWQ
jgi:adenine-specific DNA methylase